MKVMSKIWNKIKVFFTEVDYSLLWKSLQEVLWLTTIAFIPLIINVLIAAIPVNNFTLAFKTKIIPGEVLSYSFSFIAPIFYLIIKTHGNNYKLPFIKTVSIVAFLIYTSTVFLYLTAKNGWDQTINLKPHEIDYYYILALVCLGATILLRIYSVYHGGNYGNYMSKRERDQENFNSEFSKSITGA